LSGQLSPRRHVLDFMSALLVVVVVVVVVNAAAGPGTISRAG
jgi:hypothetical protein